MKQDAEIAMKVDKIKLKILTLISLLLLCAAIVIMINHFKSSSRQIDWQGAADCLIQYWNPYLQSREDDAKTVRFCVKYGSEISDLKQIYKDPAK